jgi:hypothetical protein
VFLMEDRLAGLEAKVGELTEAVRALRTRVSALEDASGETAEEAGDEASLPSLPRLQEPAADSALPLFGTASLVLGGAFLLRLLSETGVLSPPVGLFAGLSYAAFWLGAADRTGRHGRRLAALVLGVTGLLIVCPLLVEAAARFKTLDVPAAAALLAVFTAGALAVALRRSLPALAWAATLLPAATAFALIATNRALLGATFFLVVLGVATDRLAESSIGGSARWPAAAAANLAVLTLILVAARPGGAVGPYRELSLSAARLAVLLLPAGYLGSFAVRLLRSKREAGIFEALQTVLALMLGGLGARMILPAESSGAELLVPAGLVAILAYLAAILAPREGPRRFLYFSTTALAILLLFFARGPARFASVFWCVFSLAAAAAAVRWRRPVLAVHSVAGLVLAALHSGLAASIWALATSSDLAPIRPSLLILGAALCGAAVYVLLAGREPPDRRFQFGAAFGAGLTAAALWAGIILLAATALGLGREAVVLAAMRGGVLTLLTIGLAAAAARGKRVEITWLAWALLAAGAVKLLLQDAFSGRAAVLALSFALFGIALIVAPRFLRAAGGRPAQIDAATVPTHNP